MIFRYAARGGKLPGATPLDLPPPGIKVLPSPYLHFAATLRYHHPHCPNHRHRTRQGLNINTWLRFLRPVRISSRVRMFFIFVLSYALILLHNIPQYLVPVSIFFFLLNYDTFLLCNTRCLHALCPWMKTTQLAMKLSKGFPKKGLLNAIRHRPAIPLLQVLLRFDISSFRNGSTVAFHPSEPCAT